MDDNELIEFYLKHKEDNTEIYQKWCAQEKLKKSPLFMEMKNWVRICLPAILREQRHVHLIKATGESSG